MAEQTDRLDVNAPRWSIGSPRRSQRSCAGIRYPPLLPDVAVLHPVRSWLPHRVAEIFVLGRLEPIADPPATRCVDDNSIARG